MSNSQEKIAEYFGKSLNQKSVNNIWIPDGFKDYPYDRLAPRQRLTDSLNQIFSDDIDNQYVLDTMESKLFGIGSEAYTVGSHEFYLGYALKKQQECLHRLRVIFTQQNQLQIKFRHCLYT